jgi:hypothetical protein
LPQAVLSFLIFLSVQAEALLMQPEPALSIDRQTEASKMMPVGQNHWESNPSVTDSGITYLRDYKRELRSEYQIN